MGISSIIISVILLFAYGLSDFFIFQPPYPAHYSDTDIKINPHLLKIKTVDGATISALYLLNSKAKYTLLFSHGNAEDLGTQYSFFTDLYQHGYSVFAYDYHGYGTSTGRPSEKNAYHDVNAAYQYLTAHLHISPNHIIAYGYSLGGAVALDLASRKPVAGLILEAPFVSAFRVVTVWPILPFDKFNNLKKIPQIHCPLLIIHGKKDRIIPFWHGQKLYHTANPPKYFLQVEKARHLDILQSAGDTYWNALKAFSHRLNRVRGGGRLL